MNKYIQILKKLSPFIFLLVFIFLIHNYYKNNKDDFSYIYNLKLEYLTIFILLCLFYLVTETFILKGITKHFKKKINNTNGFLVICGTYFCNTFLQFSGLGFRAYYLKKNFKIKVSDFIFISIFFIYMELLVFSISGFCSIFIIDFFNKDVSLVNEIKAILLIFSIVLILLFFIYDRIIFFILNFFNLKNKSFCKNLILFLNDSNNLNLKTSLKNVSIFYILQFFTLCMIFFLGYFILEKDNLLILSAIGSTFTDFSFIFTFTPYAIGISETFLFVSNFNFELKISEILFLTNIFRLSMFIIYFPIGSIFLFKFLKNNK
jgi:uncharacterized membrane protein YbhN (UPF0104 family)|tara:strand:- start:20 stop:976 length:957 start_codon:yes stop_codon:yes gene_type:complete